MRFNGGPVGFLRFANDSLLHLQAIVTMIIIFNNMKIDSMRDIDTFNWIYMFLSGREIIGL